MKELIYENTVFAPRGGKPGYIVNGKWYPVDKQDLGSEGFKKEMERYEKLRGKEQIQKDISSLKPKSKPEPPPSPKPEPEIGSKDPSGSGKIYVDSKYGYQSLATIKKERLLPSEALGSEPEPAAQPAPAPEPAAQPTPAPAPAKPAPAPAATTQPTRPAPKPLETRMSSVTGKREFVGTTADGTKFERRAATGAELRAAQAARKAALVSKPEDKKGAEKEAVKAGVGASRPSGAPSSSTSTSSSPIQALKPKSEVQSKSNLPGGYYSPSASSMMSQRARNILGTQSTSPTPKSSPTRNGFGVPTAPLAAKLSAATLTAPPTPISTPKPASSTPAPKPASSTPAPKPVRLQVVPFKDSYEYDAYDLVLEYLLSQGHADTLEEANYVMLEMNAEMIGDIVEVMGKVPSVIQSSPKNDPKPSKDKKVPQETGVTGDGKGEPMDYLNHKD